MKHSAGLLLYKKRGETVDVLLVHPGGPFWAKKDMWSVPKGEHEEGETPLETARREFEEELGFPAPEGELVELGDAVVQGKNKTNRIWALEGNVDLSKFNPGSFSMEWPTRSGKMQEFPEDDRVEWFDLTTAKQKLFAYQKVLIDRLAEHLGVSVGGPEGDAPADNAQTKLF